MYLRWQKRKRRKREYGKGAGPDIHWAAILGESKRVNGKPTQQHVAYLGGITESAVEIPAQRCYFWENVAQRLDELGLSPADRRRIEAAVAERAPRPTKREYEKLMRGIQETYGVIHPLRDLGWQHRRRSESGG